MLLFFSFISEIYFFVSLAVLLVFFISYNLSSKLNFPHTYDSNVYLSVILLIYTLVLSFSDIVYNTGSLLIKTQSSVIISQLMVFFTILLFLVTISYNKRKKIISFEFFFFVLVSLGGFIVLLSTYNLIIIFIIIELQTLIISLLISIDKLKRYNIESSIKYFLLNTFSSLLLVYGFSTIFGGTGVLCLSELHIVLHLIGDIDNSVVLTSLSLSSNLILLGLFFKIYSSPFNLWLPDVYQGTPKSVLLYISTVQSLFMLLFVYKIYNIIICDVLYWNMYLLYIIAISTIISGVIGALLQTSIKKIISYSTITVNGIFMFSLLHNNIILMEYFFTYLLVYIIFIFLIFNILLNVSINNREISNIQDLFNLYSCNKVIGSILCVLMFSISGLPPFVGFVVKLFWLKTVVIEYNLFVLFFILIFMLIIYYYFRFIKYAYTLNYSKSRTMISVDYLSYGSVALLVFFSLITIYLLLYTSVISNLVKIIVMSIITFS